jgi:hypothetical protein
LLHAQKDPTYEREGVAANRSDDPVAPNCVQIAGGTRGRLQVSKRVTFEPLKTEPSRRRIQPQNGMIVGVEPQAILWRPEQRCLSAGRVEFAKLSLKTKARDFRKLGLISTWTGSRRIIIWRMALPQLLSGSRAFGERPNRGDVRHHDNRHSSNSRE